MWRRRDEANAGSRVPGLGDALVDLVAGKLAALSRLCPLRHLDLELVRVSQVLDGDAEPPGGDLFDGGPHRIPVRQRLHVPLRVLTSLTCVGLPADTVHGHRERRVRFHADAAIAHSAGAETLQNRACWLDLGKLQGSPADVGGTLEIQSAPQGHAPHLICVQGAKLLIGNTGVVASSLLEACDGIWIVDVALREATRNSRIPVMVQPVVAQVVPLHLACAHCIAACVKGERVAGEFLERRPADARDCVRKAEFNDLIGQTKRFEDLGPLVALKAAHAHFAHHLHDSFSHCLPVVVYGLLVAEALGKLAITAETPNATVCPIRVHGITTETEEHTEVMDLVRLCALQDNTTAQPLLRLDQVRMCCRNCKQTAYRHPPR
mmetsp:Transcript_97252/g.243816  ORF Transcript_97252/g.243816 Transcript_97252/m.243816 type:complete len:378 (-) Transcript_97252:1839-2972(-)